jgi:hypothetical protein
MYSIEKNIGVIRNTGTELAANARVFESRGLSWNVGVNLSNTNSLVVSLNKGQQAFCLTGNLQNGGSCVVPGYPLFSDFAQPITFFADANHDGIIEPNEIHIGDSSVFVGQQEPKYQLNLNSGLTLLNGRLSVSATFAYQNGLTQYNGAGLTSGAFSAILNQPNTSLATQAAVVAATAGSDACSSLCSSTIGLYQTVNSFRFNELSINYELPTTLASWFRVPRMIVALQGKNLGLHTNYRGKDPNVNAFSTVSAGDETADLGQTPEPRVWWLKLTMGN